MRAARRRGRGRAALATAVAGVVLCGSATAARAETWWATVTLVNQTGETLPTCASSPPWGCLQMEGGANVVDGSWVGLPNQVPASGGTNATNFQFLAPDVDEGADAFVGFTDFGNNQWYISQFNDVNWFSGNYTSECTATVLAPLGESLGMVCQPSWANGDTHQEALFVPYYVTSYDGTTSGTVGAGATCAFTDVATDAVLSCSPGPLGTPAVDVFYRSFVVASTGDTPVQVFQNYIPACQLSTPGSSCTLPPGVGGDASIQIGLGDGASSGDSIGIQVMSVALVPQNVADDANLTLLEGMLTAWAGSGGDPGGGDDPPGDGSDVAAVRARRRPQLAVSGFRASRRPGHVTPQLRYQARRAGADTVFALQRRAGGRWTPVPGLRRLSRYDRTANEQLWGHFVHRDRRGVNRVAVPSRVAGRRLTTGRYRVLARTRLRRDTGARRSTTFTIAPRRGEESR